MEQDESYSKSLHFQVKELNYKSRSYSLIKKNKKEYESHHTRRKSCLCTECGKLGRFQFENMNVEFTKNRKIKKNTSIKIDDNTLTLPKHEVFFQRQRIVRKTMKKPTANDINITGEKIEDQRNQILAQNSSSKTCLLSSILVRRESSIKFTNQVVKTKKLLDELKYKINHLPIIQIKLCSTRIKTENLSYHNVQLSPSQNKNNYKNSPYYYTYRQVLTPKIKTREQIKIKQQVHVQSMIKI